MSEGGPPKAVDSFRHGSMRSMEYAREDTLWLKGTAEGGGFLMVKLRNGDYEIWLKEWQIKVNGHCFLFY